MPTWSDQGPAIARDDDVFAGDGAVACPGLFVIEKEDLVRHQVVNDIPLERSVAEALRMVDALRFHEQHGEVCFANRSKGKEGVKPSAEGVAA